MSIYQTKWLEVLTQINIPGWKFNIIGEDIAIKVPDNKNIKELADNLETVIAEVSLDIKLPKERLRFVISNSREEVDYILNPGETDLTTDSSS